MFPKYALYSSSNLLNNNISLVTGYHATWYFIVLMVNAGQSIPGIVSQQFPMVRVITGYFSAVGIHFFVFRVILYLSPGRKRLENRRKLQTLTKLCHSRLLIEGLYEYRVPGIHYAGIAFGFFFFFLFFFVSLSLFQILDELWPQVSPLFPPGTTCLQFLSRIGFSVPAARRLSSNVAIYHNSRFRAFR